MTGHKRPPGSVRLASNYALWRLNQQGRLALVPPDGSDVEPINADGAKDELRRLVDERYPELGRFPRLGESVQRADEA